jgi:biofilm PGA synthesis N-glycosyltransferase PgaC
VALFPGLVNCFIFCNLLFDKKPRSEYNYKNDLPPISVLIAAYNEQDNIISTLQSIALQDYPNTVQCIIINDGSSDNTSKLVHDYIESDNHKINFKIIDKIKNNGKANALNTGLKLAKYKNIITVDGDCYIYKDCFKILVSDFMSSNDVAMAGAILVKNSRENWITKFQEQDFFYSISSVKRSQHLTKGVLVAQGALSIYKKWMLEECGGWKPVVGEDIILSWDILNRGYTIGHSDRAICWTNVPTNYKQYFQQRRRWARGMIEAFREFPGMIFNPRVSTIFIWFNLLFPLLDFYYLFIFVPSLIMALVFKYYLIVSSMTLMLLPMGALMNLLMFKVHINVFKIHGLKVRKHYFWIFFYFLFGNLLSAPASLRGYLDEFLNTKKSWGTK